VKAEGQIADAPVVGLPSEVVCAYDMFDEKRDQDEDPKFIMNFVLAFYSLNLKV
ncbi:hypothetical protein Tco_0408049, partial [Tanacetum coccineum]